MWKMCGAHYIRNKKQVWRRRRNKTWLHFSCVNSVPASSVLPERGFIRTKKVIRNTHTSCYNDDMTYTPLASLPRDNNNFLSKI